MSIWYWRIHKRKPCLGEEIEHDIAGPDSCSEIPKEAGNKCCAARGIFGAYHKYWITSVLSVLTEVPVALSCVCMPHACHGISLHRCFAPKKKK